MVPYVLGHMFRCRPLRPDQIFQQDPVHAKGNISWQYIYYTVSLSVIQHDNEKDKTQWVYIKKPQELNSYVRIVRTTGFTSI